jgi:hypothetical protein
MKRLISLKSIATAAVVLGAFGAATAAHARSDVFFSIGVQAPGGYGYVQPAPVYVQPEPVYVQPEPAYVPSQPVYVQPQYGYGWDGYDRDGYGRRHWRHAHRYGPYGDYDHDGVPNRYDRFPSNPYRR